MPKLTFYGGVRELGGNQILLEDKGTRVLLDFGQNFDRSSKYFAFPYMPKKFNALGVYLRLGIYPGIEGIYRQDYLRQIGKEPGKRNVDAVLLSHAHVDHAAGIHFLRPDIDVWMDQSTKRILYAMQFASSMPYTDYVEFTYTPSFAPGARGDGEVKLQGEAVSMPRSIKLWLPGRACPREIEPQRVKIGDIEVEPYYVDHAMPGACAFIVYTSAGPVVYTGDIRVRGRRRRDTEKFVKAAKACEPSYLLCEGSLIDKKHVGDEEEVANAISEFIKDRRGLVVCAYPPRDLDRLATLYKVAQRSGRELVIDTKQAFILDLFSDNELGYPKTWHKHIRIFLPRKGTGSIDTQRAKRLQEADYPKWERAYIEHRNRVTLEEIKSNPRNYMIFLPFSRLDDLVELDPPKDSVYIRSHPQPYTAEMELDESILVNWIKEFNLHFEGEQGATDLFSHTEPYNVPQAHVTGHMSYEETEWLVNEISPKTLIPIHTLYPEWFKKMYSGNVELVGLGQTLEL